MIRARTLSLFSLQTPKGRELRDAIITLAYRLRFEVKPELPQPTLTHVAQAVYCDDVVIFDGSIEGKHNYKIAFDGLKRVDHALIVSRTPLPLNFYGTRASDDLTCANAPRYPNTLSNEAILKWLEQMLPTLPHRPLLQKNPMAYPCIADHSANAAAHRLKEQSQIYISYRSGVFKKVAELSAALRRGAFHNGAGRSVNFVQPGMLAYDDEALADLRRWIVLSIISDVIQACEEFWIYHSDDYLDSWWTRGELAILAYFKESPKKIVRYIPTTGERRTLSYDDIPTLSDEQRNRITRMFSDSHPNLAGVESAGQLQRFGRMLGLRKISFFSGSARKDVLSKHDAIIECNSKQCINRLRKTRTPDTLLFDMDAFLSWRDPNLFKQAEGELEKAAGRQGVKCKHCGTRLTVTNDRHARFITHTLSDARSGDGPRLERLPVYRIEAQPGFWHRMTNLKC